MWGFYGGRSFFSSFFRNATGLPFIKIGKKLCVCVCSKRRSRFPLIRTPSHAGVQSSVERSKHNKGSRRTVWDTVPSDGSRAPSREASAAASPAPTSPTTPSEAAAGTGTDGADKPSSPAPDGHDTAPSKPGGDRDPDGAAAGASDTLRQALGLLKRAVDELLVMGDSEAAAAAALEVMSKELFCLLGNTVEL